jgi:hypothetical protein
MAAEKSAAELERGINVLKTGAQADQASGGAITEALKGVSREQLMQLAAGMQGTAPRA